MAGFTDVAKYALPGLGFLTGLFGNRPQETSFSNTSTLRRYLTPEQTSQLPQISSYLSSVLDSPDAGLGPLRTETANRVNSRYSNVPSILKQKYLTAGNSGKYGTAARSAEVARLGELADVDLDFAGKVTDQKTNAVQMILQLLGMNFGQDIASSGTSKIPGNMTAGGLAGGTSGLLELMRLLKG